VVRFAHLHTHSHFSLLEGNAQIDDLCAAAAEDGQTHLALTDHGNLFGAIEFYKAATGKGLRPILGCEATLVKDRRVRDAKEPGSHLTLLAENAQGYRNLIKIVSAGYLEGFYFRPRVDREVIQKYHEGIIALSGCMSGEVSRRLIAGDMDAAARAACEWRDVFGADRFFLEVMENQIPLQRRQREGMLALAEATGIKAVLTQDVHYIRPEDARAREVMMCIGSGKTLKDENRRRLETDQQHFRTAAEMAALFKGAELLCENAYDVATRCNVELRFDEFHLPKFQVPGGEDPLQFFRRCCDEGAKRRYGAPLTERIVKRLEYEIDVIRELGFVAYFLIVRTSSAGARCGIPVGPGRGSAAGSIVAYCLGITDVDPLRYDLLFERFLNPAACRCPTSTSTSAATAAAKSSSTSRQKYGDDCVCQIVTFGTMASRGVLRDVGRVLDFSTRRDRQDRKKVPHPGRP
jgi:DNA polymerase-3 subunit alpha